MTQDKLKEYLLKLPNTWPDASLGDELDAYKTGDKTAEAGKLFAIIHTATSPLRVSLRCDPNLAETLREQYETVLPGENLSRKDWNTVICSGQLSDEEVLDLVLHAHQLVTTELSR